MRIFTLIAMTCALIAATACDRSPRQSASAAAGAATRAPAGNITITSTDRAISLAFMNDTISMGLTDSLLQSTRRDMDTSVAADSGLGSFIAKTVKGAVGSALGTRITYPLSDIRSVRYENGEIQFDYRHKHAMSFEGIRENGAKSALASFSPDDARWFVASVQAALERQAGTQ
ncbi:MAG: hypothetical protein ACREOJ_00830 [Gemmatimonadaceae bacterium]